MERFSKGIKITLDIACDGCARLGERPSQCNCTLSLSSVIVQGNGRSEMRNSGGVSMDELSFLAKGYSRPWDSGDAGPTFGITIPIA